MADNHLFYGGLKVKSCWKEILIQKILKGHDGGNVSKGEKFLSDE